MMRVEFAKMGESQSHEVETEDIEHEEIF